MSPAHYALHVKLTDATRYDPVTIIAVTGEIDLTNSADFEAEIKAFPGPRPIVLDLSELMFFGSAGFAALDGMLGNNAVIVVVTPHSTIRKAATLMGVPYHDDIALAQKAALSQTQPPKDAIPP